MASVLAFPARGGTGFKATRRLKARANLDNVADFQSRYADKVWLERMEEAQAHAQAKMLQFETVMARGGALCEWNGTHFVLTCKAGDGQIVEVALSANRMFEFDHACKAAIRAQVAESVAKFRNTPAGALPFKKGAK